MIASERACDVNDCGLADVFTLAHHHFRFVIKPNSYRSARPHVDFVGSLLEKLSANRTLRINRCNFDDNFCSLIGFGLPKIGSASSSNGHRPGDPPGSPDGNSHKKRDEQQNNQQFPRYLTWWLTIFPPHRQLLSTKVGIRNTRFRHFGACTMV